MANTPRYKLTIPSTGKSVTYRPFLIKEEKALLIAQQSEDPETMITTLKSVIESCIIDPIKSSDLAIFDIEYIFTQLRSKSVGEIVESKADLIWLKLNPMEPAMPQVEWLKKNYSQHLNK